MMMCMKDVTETSRHFWLVALFCVLVCGPPGKLGLQANISVVIKEIWRHKTCILNKWDTV